MNNQLKLNNLSFELYLEQPRIERRIYEMALQFNQNLSPGRTMVPVMTGAFYFAAEFLQHIDKPYRLMSIQASSYQGVDRTENVRISILKEELMVESAYLVILEDIIDSGHTAHMLEKRFYDLGAAGVEVISLFYKPDRQRYACNLKMYGFSVGPEFLVGYGLDVNEEGRYLKDVYRQL